MNKVKRLVALVLVVCMFIPTYITANAYASLTLKSSANVQGATYYNYSVYGSVSGNTADVDVIKFNIADNIIPMAYATQAGKTNVLNNHVQAAVAEGYEVIGAINASFFDMSSGDPCGALISNGKIIYDHAEKNDTVITAFDINGTPTLLGDATLSYSLNLNGTSISSAIGMVNKDYTACNMVSATISTRFHYYDADAGSLANSAQTGYEILCKKLNGTDIAVGKTLQGEVISVTSGYYGKTVVTSDDQFVLFVKSASTTYANYAKALYAGAPVSLTVTATNSWANQVLSSCHSAISSTYWLVQNGVDLTDTTSEIIHNTSTVHRAWTAFGWDDNGNYYFFTSQENKLSLKDVADALISMGATNVLRLDGGGSTTMYVNGYGLVENAGSRAITDCLLIVKKPNVQGTADNLASDRNYTISVTNDPVIDTEWGTDYSANLTDGEAGQTFASDGSWFAFNANKNTVNGVGTVTVDFDKLCDITQLKLSLANQSDWGVNAPASIKAYSSLDGVNYTYIGNMPLQSIDGNAYWSVLDTSVRAGSVRFEFTLNGTWAMVNELEVHGTETSIAFPYEGAADNLASDRDYTISVTNDPIVDATWNNDYSANLTDGVAAMEFNGSNGSWFAFSSTHNTVNGIGTVTVDFDKLCDITKFRLSLVNESSWGVYAPTSIKVYGSADGIDYTYIGTMPTQNTDTTSYWSTLNVTNARYGSVRFEFTLNGTFAMVNELEVYGTATDTDFHTCKPNANMWYTDNTYHWHKCGTCGKELDKTIHTFGEWYASSSATCTVNGENRRDCTACNYSETETVTATGHNYVGAVTNPTCTAQGYTTYTCTNCSGSYVGDYVSALGHSYNSAVTNPTCTAGGYTTYTCSACGDNYISNKTNALGHSFGEWYTVTPVSCESTGLKQRDCNNCDHSETEVISATGHSYSTSVTAPTCTEKGYTTYTCSVCNNSYKGNYVAATGHSYTSVVTQPTCTEKGYTTHTCNNCDDAYTDAETSALGHGFGEWYTVNYPDCENDGLQQRDCSNCDHFETEIIKSNGHGYESTVVPPTCLVDGYTKHVCFACGDEYTTDIITAKGHIYGDWKTIDSPTCEEKGMRRRDCGNCSFFQLEELAELGHDYISVVTAPTCEDKGFTTHTCGNCGDVYTDAETPALGHNYNSVVTNPTCEDAGYTTHTCGTCGNVYTDAEIEALGHSYTSVVTAPTCLKGGYTTHTCDNCGNTYNDSITQAAGHKLGDWVVIDPATADDNGYEERYCENCSHFEYRETPALGHNYQSMVRGPSCTMPGYTYYYCDCCGNSYTDNYVDPLGHSYGEWYTVTEADCEKDGLKQRDCSVCDHSETEEISATGHSYSSVVTAPTCEDEGYTTHTCGNCGNSYTDAETEALGHSYGEWYTVTEPDCENTGLKQRDCNNCDHYETEAIKEIGHSYSSVVTAPTCEDDGFTTHTCGNCGDIYTDAETPKLGHSYNSVVTAPTCEDDGYTTHTCGNCGDVYTDAETEALGHDFNEWYTVTEADCEKDGLKQRDCNNCDHYETEVISAFGHNYSEKVTAPTCTARGYTTYTCACGDSYIGNYVNATGHSYTENVTAPTCEATGYTTYTCTCGDSYTDNYTAALGHTFGEWYTVTEAKCESTGLKQRDCNNCDHYETEVINLLGHKYIEKVTAPTCTQQGYTTYTCICGDSYTENYVNATGHSHSSVVTAPTCTTQGYTTYTCACGDSYKDNFLDELGHNFNNYQSDNNASCLTDGTKTSDCGNEGCEEKSTITDINTAKGHTPSDEWIIVTPAQLGTDGLKELHCGDCGDVIATESIPALHYSVDESFNSNSEGHWLACGCGCSKKFDYTAHTPGVWETVSGAGIDVEGKKELRCTECNHLIAQESIPAIHQSPDGAWHSDNTYHWQECACGQQLVHGTHTPTDWVVVIPARVGAEGKKEIRCSVCNALLDEEIIPALEEPTPTVKLLRGDINGNNKIDARDYLLLKRAYFGTYTLTCLNDVADINGNGKIDARDYLLLKRAYFGTYSIPESIKYITK